jgi:hypothetical protein
MPPIDDPPGSPFFDNYNYSVLTLLNKAQIPVILDQIAEDELDLTNP